MGNGMRARDEGRRVTLFGMAGNLLLIGVKFGVGLATGSMSLVADGVHSFSDLATDLVVLGGMRLASRPPDESHAYGHGKYETLAGATVALALFGVGVWLVWEAVVALLRGGGGAPAPAVVGVAGISILIKEWMFRVTRRVAHRVRSPALEANAWHHRSDALSSVAVLCGGGAMALGFPQGDQAAAIAVGGLVMWAAMRVLRRALHDLTEGAFEEEERTHVVQAIEAIDGVEGWHRLRTRYSGRNAIVDVHIQVDPTISVRDSHQVASRVEAAVRATLGGQASVTVHVEPRGDEEPEIN